MVDAVLNGILSMELKPLENLATDSDLDTNDPTQNLLSDLKILYEDLMKNKDLQETAKSESIVKVYKIIESQLNALQGSRTAKLWLQYMKMVDILKMYLKAERLGDWQLHLKATADMLPFFAATGHNNYLKSSYLYLQQMHELPTTTESKGRPKFYFSKNKYVYVFSFKN